MTQQAYRYLATTGPQGRIELNLPLPPGTAVEVFVLSPADDENLSDLVSAANSALEFWDHPLDDEDWNNA